MNSVARVKGADRGERIQIALLGSLPTAWPLSWKGRRKGTLVVTHDGIGFLPVDRLGRMRPFPYSAITSVQVRSFLGHRTVAFHTQEESLTVRCLASRKDLADLFEYVNSKIPAAAGKARLTAKHALTKLTVGTDDSADDQGEDEYEEVLRYLFQEANHQETEMSRVSALSLSELAELSSGGCQEEHGALADVKSLSAKGGAATQTKFRGRHGGCGKQAIPATAKRGNDRRVLPHLAFMSVGLWGLCVMVAYTLAWPAQGQQQQTEHPLTIVPRKPEASRNTASNRPPREISGPQPDRGYARPADSFESSNATQIAAERPDNSEAPQSWTTSSHDALLPQLTDYRNYRLLASLIQKQRKAVGMTQAAVALATGWSPTLIVEIEDGTYHIDLIELIQLSEVIRLDVNAALNQMHQRGDQ